MTTFRFPPLALFALAALVPAAPAFQSAAPYHEEALFTASVPRTAKPVSKASPAWEAKVALDAKGLPLRAVLAGVLDQAGVSYAIDPALDATVYASVKATTLRDAVAILARVCDFEVKSEAGVWYAVRREPKALPAASLPPVRGAVPAKPARNVPADPFADPSLAIAAPARSGGPTLSGGIVAPQEIAKTDRQRFPIGASALPARSVTRKATPQKAAPQKSSSQRPAAPPVKTPAPTIPAAASEPLTERETAPPNLAKRVTTRLPKADLRAVFAAFSTQTGIGITVDESVPRYRVDAYLKATSLKYALNEVTRAAGLTWSIEGDAIRITKPE